jgi:hypothetical protein
MSKKTNLYDDIRTLIGDRDTSELNVLEFIDDISFPIEERRSYASGTGFCDPKNTQSIYREIGKKSNPHSK